jgi:EAL domain-containing protein (putative c-di-GMP-specific phosphodiesterase class I)
LQSTDEVLSPLRQLDHLGISLVIDDFGIGYSSLSYLKNFPIRKLKIDRSFVAELDRSSAVLAIVKAVIGLAASLSMDVVAEGIETEAQCAVLSALGCTLGQGFLFGRPTPESELARFLAP